jgi:hypothetical protein
MMDGGEKAVELAGGSEQIGFKDFGEEFLAGLEKIG